MNPIETGNAKKENKQPNMMVIAQTFTVKTFKWIILHCYIFIKTR